MEHAKDNTTTTSSHERKRKKDDGDLEASAVTQPTVRFKSPYIFYTLERQYEVLKELGPDALVNDICRRIASDWQKLTPEKRAPWEEKARLDKERVLAEMSGSKLAHERRAKKPKKHHKTRPEANKIPDVNDPEEKIIERTKECQGPKKESSSKQQKDHHDSRDPSKPKRPVTAYLFFAQKNRPIVRAENPHMSGLEITKRIGELWNEATAAHREPYQLLEAESRAEYQRAMKEWQLDHEEEECDGKTQEQPQDGGVHGKDEAETCHEEQGASRKGDRLEHVEQATEVRNFGSDDEPEEARVVCESQGGNERFATIGRTPPEFRSNLFVQQGIPAPFVPRAMPVPQVMAQLPVNVRGGALRLGQLPTMQTAYFMNQGLLLQYPAPMGAPFFPPPNRR